MLGLSLIQLMGELIMHWSFTKWCGSESNCSKTAEKKMTNWVIGFNCQPFFPLVWDKMVFSVCLFVLMKISIKCILYVGFLVVKTLHSNSELKFK